MPGQAGRGAEHGGTRANIVKSLADKYQETGRALGMAGPVAIIEVFASKAGTWTILSTSARGFSCVIAACTEWEEPPEIPGERL